MTYFVVQDSEDGRTITEIERAELDKMMTEFMDADNHGDGFVPHFVSQLPGAWNSREGIPRDGLLLIKGDIVVPKAMRTATKWVVE